MVKLTTELIMNSYQFINPVKDRELDLRGKHCDTIMWSILGLLHKRIYCFQQRYLSVEMKSLCTKIYQKYIVLLYLFYF